MARNYFITIVAGDDFNSLLKPYNKNNDDRKIIYYYKDASFIKENYIKVNENILHTPNNLSETELFYIKENLKIAKASSDDDFYFDFTSQYEYDENLNALSNENVDGKYRSYMIGKLFSVPFTLKDGTTSFSAKKCDIDWDKMHLHNKEIYEAAWDMVMENKTPETDEEKLVYENMKNRTLYFQEFGNKETYVTSNTSFWGYAFLSEETNWIDAEKYDQFTWMMNFYDTFIKPLPDDTLLTIVECSL